MRERDPADSHLAAAWPDPAQGIDHPRDYLREAFAAYRGRLPGNIEDFRRVAFELIDAAIEAAGPQMIAAASGGLTAESAVVRLVQIMSRDRDPRQRMDALCYLRLLGVEHRTFQAIGDELGVKRATVHSRYRMIQRKTGLRGLGDKSPTAREKCRQRRLGQRRLRTPWAGKDVWKKLSSSTLAAA